MQEPLASTAFSGAKIALLSGDHILTYLRDDTPKIPFPNHWDLAGGGRAGEESPEACALRETREEFGLTLAPDRIHWKRRYPSTTKTGRCVYFMVAEITAAEIASIIFGNEGQRWQMMPIAAFLTHDRAVPDFQTRLADYLASGA